MIPTTVVFNSRVCGHRVVVVLPEIAFFALRLCLASANRFKQQNWSAWAIDDKRQHGQAEQRPRKAGLAQIHPQRLMQMPQLGKQLNMVVWSCVYCRCLAFFFLAVFCCVCHRERQSKKAGSNQWQKHRQYQHIFISYPCFSCLKCCVRVLSNNCVILLLLLLLLLRL